MQDLMGAGKQIDIEIDDEDEQFENLLESKIDDIRQHRPSVFASVVVQKKVAFKPMKGFRKVANYREIYTLENILGKGGYGIVYEAKNKEANEVCAIKVMNKKQLAEKKENGLKFVRREIEALEKIAHTNIVRVLDLCEDEENICVVMELVPGGNLMQFLKERTMRKKPITETEAATIIHQILLAINHIHNQSPPMVHRDLKPDNILIEQLIGDDDEEGEIVCKLTDFGMAFEVMPDVEHKDICGTEKFMAPEVTKGQRKQTTKVDIWSLGVLTYVMLIGTYPFQGGSRDRTFEAIFNRKLNLEKEPVKKRLDVFTNEGKLIKDFLTLCMKKKPEDRPTASELL